MVFVRPCQCSNISFCFYTNTRIAICNTNTPFQTETSIDHGFGNIIFVALQPLIMYVIITVVAKKQPAAARVVKFSELPPLLIFDAAISIRMNNTNISDCYLPSGIVWGRLTISPLICLFVASFTPSATTRHDAKLILEWRGRGSDPNPSNTNRKRNHACLSVGLSSYRQYQRRSEHKTRWKQYVCPCAVAGT